MTELNQLEQQQRNCDATINQLKQQITQLAKVKLLLACNGSLS